ncbi:MAG: hypothetical protein NDP09_06655 [Crenarchaeota archaeon]|nr:hypothetical protein [Thermoproteota archaeon]
MYNVVSEDRLTVNDVVSIEELGLNETKVIHKPILHGIGWPGDVKRIILSIDKLMNLGFKPRFNSKEAMAITIAKLKREFWQRWLSHAV